MSDTKRIKACEICVLYRYKATSLTSPYTFSKVFKKNLSTANPFICSDCCRKLREKTVRQSVGRVIRHTWPLPRTPKVCASTTQLDQTVNPPSTTQNDQTLKSSLAKGSTLFTPVKKKKRPLPFSPGEEVFKKPDTKCTPKKTGYDIKLQHLQPIIEQTVKYLSVQQYDKAVRTLIKNDSAKRAMFRIVTQTIQHELHNVTKHGHKQTVLTLTGSSSLKGVEDFSWSSVIDECEEKIPLLTQVVTAAVPSESQIARACIYGRKGAKRFNIVSTSYDKIIMLC